MKNMKKLLLMGLLLSFVLTVLPLNIVWAAEKALVFDEVDVLTSAQTEELNRIAGIAAGFYDVDVAFVLADSVSDSLSDYAASLYSQQSGALDDAIILIVDEGNRLWNTALLGMAGEIFTDEMEQDLYDSYGDEDTYYGGIESYLNLATVMLKWHEESEQATEPPATTAPPAIEPNVGAIAHYYDEIGLLTDTQAAALRTRLESVSKKHSFDVVVAVVERLDHRSARLFAIDFFEDHDFGYGPQGDGAILLLAMEARDWGFATKGYGLEAFTDAGQDYLETLFLPHLRNNNYNEAFMAFADAADDFLDKAQAGTPYDNKSTPLAAEKKRGARNKALGGSLLGAVIVAFIIVQGQKSQLKSVRRQVAAGEYVRQGSMAIARQQDIFLHRHVSRTAKPKESNKSSSSGSFTSSSGSSSSGRSGKF